MNFFIIDDDPAIRMMLTDIIIDHDLGTVIGEANSGCDIEKHNNILDQVDILLLDLMMPGSCGLEMITTLGKLQFRGTTIMISQVDSKDMISKAYDLGVEYYILKPINTIEVQSIIHKVKEKIVLHQTLNQIQQSLSQVISASPSATLATPKSIEVGIDKLINSLFQQLGLAGTAGASDLVKIVKMLYERDPAGLYSEHFPKLKDIFTDIVKFETGHHSLDLQLQRSIKACEQRVRRSIIQSLIHLASLGSLDYTHPVFENYAPKFYSFSEVRKVMRDMEQGELKASYAINTKKFLQMLYIELREMINTHKMENRPLVRANMKV